MKKFKATPRQWDELEGWAGHGSTVACILELRARIEQLEAHAGNYPVTPDSSAQAPVVGGLVDRVARVVTLGSKPNICVNIWSDIAARTAILEVAKWLEECDLACARGAARLLNQEAQ